MGVEYDGAAFHGFQTQGDVATVQSALEDALSRVADEPIKVTAAGRTDAGVHATQQVVSFRTHANREIDAWRRGVNALVDDAVVVVWSREVPEGFSARFDATSRRYVYIYLESDHASALLRGRAAWTRHRMDEQLMHRAAQRLVGEHDFTSFRAAACQSNTPFRRVLAVSVARRANQVVIDITANAFLLHMVRNIAGVLQRIGRGEDDVEHVARLLELRDRTRSAPTAPPSGLYLVQVTYPGLDVQYRPPPTLC